MRIILVGYMGSGKTRFSKAIASKFNMEAVDTDRLVEKREGMTIPEIFARKGENYFRDAESRMIDSLEEMDNVIIATGGGLPCFGDNMERLRRLGTTIYLKAGVDELVLRLEMSQQKRPLIQGMDHDTLTAFVTENLQAREKFYNLADIKFNADSRDPSGLVFFIENYINIK